MNKGSLQKSLVVYAVILLFFGVACSSSIYAFESKKKIISVTNGNTLYVGGSGPGNYTHIQNAIDNASNNDTVIVYDDSSPYYEHLIVNKSITLLGENRETTIIKGNNTSSNVFINASYINIDGFTFIYGDPNGIGGSGDFICITNSIFKNCSNGIGGYFNDISISYSIFERCTNGVSVSGWRYEISDSIFMFNQNSGIYIIDGFHGKIFRNKIFNNEVGIYLDWFAYNCDIYLNTIANNSLGILDYFSFFYEIEKNNFINNTKHAYFYHENWDNIMARMLFTWWQIARLDYPFFRMHFWDGNYWDNNLFGPKIILGEYCVYGGMYNYEYYIVFKIDWHLAKEPFDIMEDSC